MARSGKITVMLMELENCIHQSKLQGLTGQPMRISREFLTTDQSCPQADSKQGGSDPPTYELTQLEWGMQVYPRGGGRGGAT